MNNRMGAILFLAAVLCSCARQATLRVVASDAGQGRVEGIVIYEDGRPTKGATVSAFPLDGGFSGHVPSADTDDLGHFQINRLWLGHYSVHARNENEGYPDMDRGYYNENKVAPITLSFSHLSANLTIVLGPKAGILRGTVADAVTGAPLDPCVDFHMASDPNDFLSGTDLVNAQYRVLVPHDRDVIMKIWHQGYLPWYYPGVKNKSEALPLHLKSGEERTLHIRMQPGNDASDAGCNTHLCFPDCRP